MADQSDDTEAIRWIQNDLLKGLGIEDLDGLGLNSWDFGGQPLSRDDLGTAVGPNVGDDYEDEVDDEIKREDEYAPRATFASTSSSQDGSPKRLRMGADSEAPRPRKKRKVPKPPKTPEPRTIKDIWPSFEPGAPVNFTQLLRYQVEAKPRAHYHPFPTEEDDAPPPPVRPPRPSLPSTINLKETSKSVSFALQAEEQALHEPGNPKQMTDAVLRRALKGQKAISDVDKDYLLNDRNYDLVNLSDWESAIIYEPSMAVSRGTGLNMQQSVNSALESGSWAQSIIWDRNSMFLDFTQLHLDDEDDFVDPAVTAAAEAAKKEKEDGQAGKRKKRRAEQSNSVVISSGLPTIRKDVFKDRFNLSNDQAYEITRERHRVRQTFGQLLVQHAYPAVKLQLPWYKTRLTKAESRSFHRPALQFPPNFELHFSKVRGAKKKKDKSGRKVSATGGGDPSEALRTTGDISLRETGPFVLLEYSEEHPPVLNNFGMGSILVNYYRKMNDEDEHVPNLDLGEPFILEANDESPFLKFGGVDRGQTIPALYNNLVRAPLFRHKADSTNFLVVKSTIAGQTRYYIREIKALFTVGQTFPVTEVPGPHSRKITATIKYRLMQMTYKLLRKTPDEHMSLKSVLKYFPDQNELQMRQRMKEFMEYHRTGPHQGFWRLKTNHEMIPDAKMFELLTPEHVVLSESMQVGQRHLLDSGYGKAAAEMDEAGDDSKLDLEQQLAPWITTKNFMHAMQNKAMIRLHGPGDHTGRGEGFSAIRVSMKEVFVRSGEDQEEAQAEADRLKTGHKYNVQQQQAVYRSEIDRIWRAQYKSLSNRVPPELSDEEDTGEKPQQSSLDQIKREESVVDTREASPMLTDRGESVVPDDGQRPKKLNIRRLIDGKWQLDTVRDPNVIAAYIKKKKEEELENMDLDQIKPTGDPIKDAAIKQRLLEHHAKLQKNQDRRLQRKNAAIIKEGGAPILLDRAPKADTSRRCSNCGQIGHMRTNRKCPRYAEFNPPGGNSAAIPTPAGASPPADATATTPGGLTGSSTAAAAAAGLMPPPPVPAFRSMPSFAGSTPSNPSPLATSPPISAYDAEQRRLAAVNSPMSPTTNAMSIPPPVVSKPKIKLSFKAAAASPPRDS